MLKKLLLSLAALSLHAQAEITDPQKLFSPKCRCDWRDPFDFGQVMPRGPHEGLCQDTCSTRGLYLPTGKWLETYHAVPGVRIAANVKHGNDFYVARIPMNGIDEVYYHVAVFPAPLGISAAHVQTRFHFRDDAAVELIPQVPGKGRPMRVRNLIYSIESSQPPNILYNVALGGMDDHYTLVFRLRTLRDFMDNGIQLPQKGKVRTVSQYRLHLTDSQKEALLTRALEYGQKSGYFRPYNSWRHSCATEFFFGVLDKVIHYTTPASVFDEIKVRYPPLNPQALDERGLLEQDARMIDLNDEKLCLDKAMRFEEGCLRGR